MRIEDCREEIDGIDGELPRRLNRRALVALEMGEMKPRGSSHNSNTRTNGTEPER